MLACMECTPVVIRSIHVLSNLGGGDIIFWGAIATSRHPLAPPLHGRILTDLTRDRFICITYRRLLVELDSYN
jgi:hypothetical protein